MTVMNSGFLDVMVVFFLLYLLLYVSYPFLSVTVVAWRLYHVERMRSIGNELKHEFYFPASILVPACNCSSGRGYDSDTLGEDMELVMKLHVFAEITESNIRFVTNRMQYAETRLPGFLGICVNSASDTDFWIWSYCACRSDGFT